jgi:hypothetical protein
MRQLGTMGEGIATKMTGLPPKAISGVAGMFGQQPAAPAEAPTPAAQPPGRAAEIQKLLASGQTRAGQPLTESRQQALGFQQSEAERREEGEQPLGKGFEARRGRATPGSYHQFYLQGREMGQSPQEAQSMANQMLGRGGGYAQAPAPAPTQQAGAQAQPGRVGMEGLSRLTGKPIPGTPGGPPSMAGPTAPAPGLTPPPPRPPQLSPEQIKAQGGQMASQMLSQMPPGKLTPSQRQMAQQAPASPTAVAATPQPTQPTG